MCICWVQIILRSETTIYAKISIIDLLITSREPANTREIQRHMMRLRKRIASRPTSYLYRLIALEIGIRNLLLFTCVICANFLFMRLLLFLVCLFPSWSQLIFYTQLNFFSSQCLNPFPQHYIHSIVLRTIILISFPPYCLRNSNPSPFMFLKSLCCPWMHLILHFILIFHSQFSFILPDVVSYLPLSSSLVHSFIEYYWSTLTSSYSLSTAFYPILVRRPVPCVSIVFGADTNTSELCFPELAESERVAL